MVEAARRDPGSAEMDQAATRPAAGHDLVLARALRAVQLGNLEAAQTLIGSCEGSAPTLGEVFRLYQSELETQAQQLSESQLRTEQTLNWFANLFRTLPVSALLLDAKGLVVDANQLALDELDLREALRILPVPLRRLMASVDGEIRLSALLPKVVAGTTVGLDDVAMRTLSGKARWADLRITQLPPRETGSDSSAGLYMCVLNDRTARVEAQRARDIATAAEHERDIAESASRTKSQLLARLSHELRTPLNAVIGFSHLLLSKALPLDKESQRKVSLISDAGQHLLALVDDVLDLNRAEAGRLPVQMGAVDLVPIAQDVLDLHQPLAGQFGLRLELIPPDHPVLARADARRTREILINLVSNAIKYNHAEGSIQVRIEGLAGTVRVAVSDTGIGMTAGQLAHLFEPFNRLGVERTTTIQGHGLGLSIARSLAAAMGGQLSATSTAGEGSCFTLELGRMDHSATSP